MCVDDLTDEEIEAIIAWEEEKKYCPGDIMDKYRDEKVNEHMFHIAALLTAISEKSAANLDVPEIFKRDPEMSFDKAVQIGMMETANKAMIEVKALATGTDRIIAMVNQMVEYMETSDLTQAKLYKTRLEVLTNFSRIANEFRPENSHQFASR